MIVPMIVWCRCLSHMTRSAVIKPAYTAGRQIIGMQAKRQLRYKTVADGVAETSREPVSTTSHHQATLVQATLSLPPSLPDGHDQALYCSAEPEARDPDPALLGCPQPDTQLVSGNQPAAGSHTHLHPPPQPPTTTTTTTTTTITTTTTTTTTGRIRCDC